MKIAVTTAPGRMEVQEVAEPVPGPGQALVSVEAVGLCGSDFHLFSGRHPYARFPQVQGHEVVGRIAAFGPGCGGPLGVGERVVLEPVLACGGCFPCRRGRYNCCARLQVMGAHVPGGLREQVVVETAQLHGVGDMALETAVLVEPLTIGLQAVDRGRVERGDDVVVLGAGPIGQAATLGAVDRGARVLMVDRVPSRLQLARHLGAEAVVDSGSQDVTAAVAAFTSGDGPRVAVEATGVPALLSLALDVVASSGTVVVVGISDGTVSIPVGLFSRKEVDVLGSRNSTGLFPSAIRVARQYGPRLHKLVTHRYSLADAPAAIRYAMDHPEQVEKAMVVVNRSS